MLPRLKLDSQMKVRAGVLVVFLLAAGTAHAGLDAIDPLIESNLRRLGGGASVSILRNDGTVLFRRHYGSFDGRTEVFIASATKWVSAAVILALVDEGKLSLDDPVARYLPSFTGEKSAITIRQLFSHTSGLPADSGLETEGCLADRFTTLAACVEEIARGPLIATPGTEFNYGGVSMQVGGRVAEVVEGKAWEAIFQERIARPLGMTAMTYRASGNPLIGGGIRTSLDDYLRFLLMIANHGVFEGRRILSAASVSEMQRDQTNGVPLVTTPYAQYAYLDPRLPATRYGLGEWLERATTSGQGLEISSQGAFGFSPWIDTQRGIVGVFMVMTMLPQAMPVYLDLKEIVHEAVPVGARRRRAVR